MPVYEHECTKCLNPQGRPKRFDFHRPFARSGDAERCPDCGAKTDRVYSAGRTKEFAAYQDEQYCTEITSARQERKLMKQHGHVYTRETPAYNKFRSQVKLARRKPFFSIPGVKISKMDRS